MKSHLISDEDGLRLALRDYFAPTPCGGLEAEFFRLQFGSNYETWQPRDY